MAGRERSAPTDGKAGRTPATAEPERATSPKGDGGTVAGPGTAVPVGGERATVDPRSERRTRVEETIGKDDDGRWSVTPRQRTERPTSGDRDPDELDRLRPVEAEEPPPSDHKNPPPSDHEEPLRDEAPADRTEVPPTDDHEADDDVEVTTPAPDDAPSTGDQGPDDDPGPAAPGPAPTPDTELATVVESSEVGGDWLYLADEGVWLDTETGAVHVTIGDRALSPDERGDLGLPPDGPVLIDARDIDWPSTPGQDQLADTGFHPGSAGPDAVYDPVTGLVYDHPGGDVVAVDPDRAVIVAGAVYNPDTGTLHGPDGTLDVGAVLTAADLTTVLGHEPPPGWNHPTSQDLPPGTTPTEGNQLVFADGTTLDDLAYDPVTGTVHRYDPDGWDTIDTPDGIIWINTDTGAVATHPNHDPYATLPQHPDGTYDTTTTPTPPPEPDATGGGGVDPAADLGDDASAQVAATVDPDTESVDIDGPTEPSEEAPAADAASDDLADGDVGPGEDTEADVGSDGLGATDTGTLTFGAGTADASDASAGGAADTGTLAFGAGATDTSDALVGRAEDPPPGDVSADPTPVATHDGVGSSAVEHGILEDDAPLDDVEPPPLADEEPGDDGIDDDTVDDPVDLDG